MSPAVCLCSHLILVCMAKTITALPDTLEVDTNTTIHTLKEHTIKVDEQLDDRLFLKTITPLKDNFDLDTNVTIEYLKERMIKAEKRFADDILSLKTYLDLEKLKRDSLESTLNEAIKRIEVLEEMSLKQNTSCACTKQIECFKEDVNKQIKMFNKTLFKQNISKDIRFLQGLTATHVDILKKFKTEHSEIWKTLKHNTSCACSDEKRQTSTVPTLLQTLTSAPTQDTMTDVPVKERNFFIVKTIDGKMNMDLKPPILSDIVVFTQHDEDVIVVTDMNNQCVKSFWLDAHTDKQFSSRLAVCQNLNYPHTTAKLTRNQIAVSCFNNRIIHIINVSPNLSMNTTIKTETANTAITLMTLPGQFWNEPRLLTGHVLGMSIVNMKGEVEEEIDSMTGIPYYLKLSPTGNTLVSEYGTHLLCITQNRKVLWKYPLEFPMGFDCDAQGNVYIADIHEDKVIVLSADGKFIKDVISGSDNIAGPVAIYYDSTKGKLFVTEGLGGSIKILEYKRRQT